MFTGNKLNSKGSGKKKILIKSGGQIIKIVFGNSKTKNDNLEKNVNEMNVSDEYLEENDDQQIEISFENSKRKNDNLEKNFNEIYFTDEDEEEEEEELVVKQDKDEEEDYGEDDDEAEGEEEIEDDEDYDDDDEAEDKGEEEEEVKEDDDNKYIIPHIFQDLFENDIDRKTREETKNIEKEEKEEEGNFKKFGKSLVKKIKDIPKNLKDGIKNIPKNLKDGVKNEINSKKKAFNSMFGLTGLSFKVDEEKTDEEKKGSQKKFENFLAWNTAQNTVKGLRNEIGSIRSEFANKINFLQFYKDNNTIEKIQERIDKVEGIRKIETAKEKIETIKKFSKDEEEIDGIEEILKIEKIKKFLKDEEGIDGIEEILKDIDGILEDYKEEKEEEIKKVKEMEEILGKCPKAELNGKDIEFFNDWDIEKLDDKNLNEYINKAQKHIGKLKSYGKELNNFFKEYKLPTLDYEDGYGRRSILDDDDESKENSDNLETILIATGYFIKEVIDKNQSKKSNNSKAATKQESNSDINALNEFWTKHYKSIGNNEIILGVTLKKKFEGKKDDTIEYFNKEMKKIIEQALDLAGKDSNGENIRKFFEKISSRELKKDNINKYKNDIKLLKSYMKERKQG